MAAAHEDEITAEEDIRHQEVADSTIPTLSLQELSTLDGWHGRI